MSSTSQHNHTDAPYQFLGFEVSYFTAKVRPALRYKGLWVDERERKRVDAALTGSGWSELLAYEPRHRLHRPDKQGRQGFELVFEPR